MQTWMRAFTCLAGALALGASACTQTYTQAEVDSQELKDEKKVTEEVKRDAQIGEQGGANSQAIEEQIETIDGGSGADF